jgi:Kef-type K+ transport system membrane component KefB
MFKGSIVWKGIVYSVLMALSKAAVAGILYVEYYIQLWNANRKRNIPSSSTETYPEECLRVLPHAQASIIAFAMVARGEIGYLIASLSQSSGTLRLQHRDGTVIEDSGEEIFLVIIWAVTLCTIAGPVSVGVLVRRFKARLSDPAALNGW